MVGSHVPWGAAQSQWAEDSWRIEDRVPVHQQRRGSEVGGQAILCLVRDQGPRADGAALLGEGEEAWCRTGRMVADRSAESGCLVGGSVWRRLSGVGRRTVSC